MDAVSRVEKQAEKQRHYLAQAETEVRVARYHLGRAEGEDDPLRPLRVKTARSLMLVGLVGAVVTLGATVYAAVLHFPAAAVLAMAALAFGILAWWNWRDTTERPLSPSERMALMGVGLGLAAAAVLWGVFQLVIR